MRTESVHWELGGLVDDERGRLSRRGVPVGDIFGIPEEVWIDGGQLYHRNIDVFGKPREPEDGMLDAFVRIESERDILRFADRWGPLGLCSHNLPRSHGKATIFFDLDDECAAGRAFEAVGAWLMWAESARGILSVAASLHQGREPSVEEWRRASQLLDPGSNWGTVEASVYSSTFEDSLMYCGDLVWAWLDMASISAKFVWVGSPQFFFWTDAFGTLGLQLAQAISRSHGLIICDGCGVAYIRQGRKPQMGRRNYCVACGTKAAVRDAQREYRARKREEHGQES